MKLLKVELLSLLIYVILTLPHLSYLIFDVGIQYSLPVCLSVGIVSVIIGNIIMFDRK